MRTLLSIAQQEAYVARNTTTIEHKWSARGMGNSKVLVDGETIARAGGCGYDRWGKVLGDAIQALFPDEVKKLADKHCKTKYSNGKARKADKFYGMFKNASGAPYLDGGCGSREMQTILNAIGFSLQQVAETNPNAKTGTVTYQLQPISKHEREWLARK